MRPIARLGLRTSAHIPGGAYRTTRLVGGPSTTGAPTTNSYAPREKVPSLPRE
jgi:hypothetical protein